MRFILSFLSPQWYNLHLLCHLFISSVQRCKDNQPVCPWGLENNCRCFLRSPRKHKKCQISVFTSGFSRESNLFPTVSVRQTQKHLKWNFAETFSICSPPQAPSYRDSFLSMCALRFHGYNSVLITCVYFIWVLLLYNHFSRDFFFYFLLLSLTVFSQLHYCNNTQFMCTDP